MPFAVYFGFETTAGRDLFREAKMYVLSYRMIFAFYPNLNLVRIVIFCSFRQKENQSLDLSHLNDQMLRHVDGIPLNQLKDAGTKVLKKEPSFALSEMFSTKLEFAIDLLVNCCDQKYKSKFLEIDVLTKQKYEKENKIDQQTKSCSCDFKLDLNSAYGQHSDKMTYLDFVIKKGYFFF